MEHCGGGRVNSYFQRLAILVLMACAVIAVLPAPTFAQFPPAPGTGPGLPETVEAIERARITTRILYVTAHPDDESGAVLTYLARGLHADVALLSLTRGEGGQNDLGPEQAPQLGLIRTQELLEATRGYGVRLYFTRAKDFGYSKTPEETERVWGDQVLEDMVRVIRGFRPNVVINGWGGVHGGHGHHQAAGLLTPKAVQLAADASFKLRGSSQEDPDSAPWGDRKPVVVLDLDRSEAPKGFPWITFRPSMESPGVKSGSTRLPIIAPKESPDSWARHFCGAPSRCSGRMEGNLIPVCLLNHSAHWTKTMKLGTWVWTRSCERWMPLW